jgi:hypothetical protein
MTSINEPVDAAKEAGGSPECAYPDITDTSHAVSYLFASEYEGGP